MALSLAHRSRRALLAACAAAAALALPAAGHAAPKAPYPPPDHPSPAAQAAAAAGHPRTPSDRVAASALAQEAYYGSHGAPDRAAAPVRVAARPDVEAAPSGGGVAITAFAGAVAVALALGVGLGRALDPLLTRLHPGAQRHGAVR